MKTLYKNWLMSIITSFVLTIFIAGCGGGGGGDGEGTAPSAPTGVTATAGVGQVTISWNAVSGATSYNIYWSTTSGVTKITGTKIANATSPYTHTGLMNGTTYYYVVTALNSYGESAESSQVSATPSTTGTAPSAPTGVTATAGVGQVTISWNAVSGATSYNIYWSTTSGVTKITGTKIANATSPYTHTGLMNGTTYYYVVTALNSYGESAESSQVSATPSTTGTAPGMLDATFGGSGTVRTPISPWPGTDEARDVAIQSNGKIVAVGRAGSDSAIVRYNTDGTLDTTFGTAGIVTSATSSYYTIAIQSGGEIIVAGSSSTDFALARYSADGSLDTTFGSNGVVTTNIGASDYVRALAIQSDGKILAAGMTQSCNGPSCTGSFIVVRYNIDGSVDASFGTGGIVTTTIGNTLNVAEAIAIQSDGKIVVAGYYLTGSDYYGWALARYDVNGVLDTTFGNGGKVTTIIGVNFNAYYYNDFAYGVAIQSDGKIVAAGGTGGNCVPPNCFEEYKFATVRYNANGTLDTSFGTGGMQLGATNGFARSVAIQSDGKIVAAGAKSGKNGFLISRYNTNGTQDSTFGATGEVNTSFDGGSLWSEGYSVAIQSDGKIVAAGYACSGVNGTNPDFMLLRYWP